jgi:hypothetical protein
MGVGSNPAVWFVAITFLLAVVRFWIDGKEQDMIKTRDSKKVTRRKAPAKRNRKKIVAALFETMWAIATNWTTALVTLSIHEKGRSPKRWLSALSVSIS